MEFDNEVITVTEAAKPCKVTRVTIWRWIKSSLLNAEITAGGHYRISREALHKLIKSKGMTCCSRTEINKHKVLIPECIKESYES